MTANMRVPLHVLVLEDEVRFRALILDVLRDMGCEAVGAPNAIEAVARCEERAPDILMLDLTLPFKDGMTFLQEFRVQHAHTPVIIITAFGDLPRAQRAIHLGVTEFLTKPCHLGEIEQAIDRARREVMALRVNAADVTVSTGTGTDELRSLEDIERCAILEALRVNGGNRSAAAVTLGISRRALYDKLKRYEQRGA